VPRRVLCGVEAEQRNMVGFPCIASLPAVCRALRGPFDVQHVIDDLKAQATAAA